VQEQMQKTGHPYDHEKVFQAQMRPLAEIVKEIEEIRAAFAKEPVFKP